MQLHPIELAIKAMLIAVATGAVLRMLRVKTAAARHAAWVGVMVVMLLLPVWTVWGPRVAVRLLEPFAEQAATYSIPAADAFEPFTTRPPAVPGRHAEWNWTAWILGIYLAGAGALLARLALGTMQAHLLLRRASRRDGKSFSGACGAPVTLGWLRPVMVLPESCSQWPAAQLDAVFTHEREHIRRRDPLFQWLALLNRAVFWFHPLAWWLERRIAALAEEACDAAVLAHGHDPRDYSGYLIEMARSVAGSGARIQVWGMAMPGGFLEQRIRRILEGGPLPQLSRPRLVCAWIACAAASAAVATSTLDRQRPVRQPKAPLLLAQIQQQAAAARPPQPAISDGPGVLVSGTDRLIHRNALEYPADARDKGIEGTVILDVTLAPDGTVADAAVIGGPMELRQTVLSSVLKWHFSPEATPRQQVSVRFSLPALKPAAASGPVAAPEQTVVRGVLGGIAGPVTDLEKPKTALTDVPSRLHVDIQGLSPDAAVELRGRLAVREGEILDHAALTNELERIHQIVQEFDPHLSDSRMVGRAARNIGADGRVIPPDVLEKTLIISLRDSAQSPGELQQFSRVGKPPVNPLENVPIRLHVDIQGLSSDATADLRRRLGVREGETTDSEGLKQIVVRIRQVMKEYDPNLVEEMNLDLPPRKFGADGKPIPWENVNATIVIKR